MDPVPQDGDAVALRQDRDIAFVHLTDLHFSDSMTSPLWAEAIARAFARLAVNTDIAIFGLAVTGDLINGPGGSGLRRVHESIVKWAKALGLVTAPDSGDPDWSRIWFVDGNHDYRKWGLFRRKQSQGIADGGLLTRTEQFRDPEKRFLVVGLNSSKYGPVARGRVELDDLRRFQRAVEADDASGYRYRVALIHHHLLPLPERPSEFDRGAAKIKRVIYDEATKLLANAGLTTEVLLRGSIDLVLHGHEHKEFSASVSYHDQRKGSRVMAVVGGPAAADGFQVIYFRRTGDLDLVRFNLNNIDYDEEGEIRLWAYEDWKRVEWDRLRRIVGYYGRAELAVELLEIGDLRQASEVTDISGGQQSIREIKFSGAAGDKKFGRVALDRVYDKEAEEAIASSALPPSGPSYDYIYQLRPPATSSRRNRGFRAVRISRNNMALTQEDAALVQPRPADGSPFGEYLEVGYQYPVRRLTYLLKFPVQFAPERIRISARLLGRGGTAEDTAETLRAQRKLIYRPGEGLAVLDLDWVTPNHQYRLSWELPAQQHVFHDYDRANISRNLIATLRQRFAADPRLRDAVNSVLADIRGLCADRIVKHARLPAAGALSVNQDDISLWAFDTDRNVLQAIVGTYNPASPFWNAELQYGAGIRGATMKRGICEFYRVDQTRHSDFYHQFDGCPPEEQLLCVPIPLPDVPRAADGHAAPLGRCWLVACIASLDRATIWHHLMDAGLRDQLAEFLMFEVLDIVKEVVPPLR